MEKEIWKDIPGYKGVYRASNLGRVQSWKRENSKILSQTLSKHGYPTVCLFGEKQQLQYVARLVLAAFVGYPDEPWLCVANYKDGDYKNCRIDNLEWIVCETTPEYDPSKSHKRGVLRPDITKQRMTEAKLNQSQEIIQKALATRMETVRKRKENNGR